ncbi:MAG: hypothetical protein ACK4JD_12580 [Thermoflexales bacterium]
MSERRTPYLVSTSPTAGRASSSGRGKSEYAPEAHVIAVGRTPPAALIAELESRLNMRVVGVSAVTDWLDPNDLCAGAHQIAAAIHEVNYGGDVILLLSPFSPSSAIAAAVAMQKFGPERLHLAYYKYQHHEMLCIDAGCLFEVA